MQLLFSIALPSKSIEPKKFLIEKHLNNFSWGINKPNIKDLFCLHTWILDQGSIFMLSIDILGIGFYVDWYQSNGI